MTNRIPTQHYFERLKSTLQKCIGGAEERSGSNVLSAFYTLILECITFGKGIPRAINGEPEIRIAPTLRHVGDTYEPEVTAWIKSRLGTGDTMIDVGSQVGIHCLLAARWLGSGGKIYAFDPSPESVSTLKRHLRLNNLSDRIEVIESAVGEIDGNALLHSNGTNPINTLAEPKDRKDLPHTLSVDVTRLDTFCNKLGLTPKLIKIDTEGWEFHVLKGAGALLSNLAVDWVVEMHPFAWQNAGYDRATFESLLDTFGLEAIALTGQHDPLADYGDVWLRHR